MPRRIRQPQDQLEAGEVHHPKSRKRPPADSMKHRLDRAEAMLSEFARNSCTLLRIIRKKYASPAGPTSEWGAKWAISTLNHLLKDMAETVSRDPHQYTWKSVLLYSTCEQRINYRDMVERVARGEIDVYEAEDGELMWREITPESRKP